MIHVRKTRVNQVDKHWLGEAFMYNSARNNWESIQDLQGYEMYIVHKDNKDIGFFLLHLYPKLSEIGASYWPHPRYCRMNMLPIIQVAFVAAVDYAKEFRYEHVILRTAEGLPCRMIKKMYHGADSYKLWPGMNLIYGKASSLVLTRDMVTLDVPDSLDSFEVDI